MFATYELAMVVMRKRGICSMLERRYNIKRLVEKNDVLGLGTACPSNIIRRQCKPQRACLCIGGGRLLQATIC